MMKEQGFAGLNRRQFMKGAAFAALALPVLPLSGCAATVGSLATESSELKPRASTGQDWAGAADGPPNPSWKTVMVSAAEPGEPLLLSGTIYGPDGSTPARGVTLYVYHTDATGYYSDKKGDSQGPPKPRLRGWMRTGDDGRYEFRTIRPGGYPGRTDPEHIHATLTADGYPEYWVDSYWFEGDPRITDAHRAKLSGRGGFQPIIALKRDEQGVLRGVRNLKLERV